MAIAPALGDESELEEAHQNEQCKRRRTVRRFLQEGDQSNFNHHYHIII
ncbi:MAG: hypothetical protein L6V88_09335 [Anaerotruncus sp.]|nr:MAG: hypothetical protein L6V88_09335 [Anaerotruncus sp.]